MRNLLLATAAVLAAAGTPTTVIANDDAAPFTPLDELDRVRTAGCGMDDFAEFLAWYSSATTGGGWLEQVVWTDYMVRVGQLADPAGEGRWVDRRDYLGQFRITSSDYGFSREAAPAAPPAAPSADVRHVTLTRLDATRYRVDWRGGPPFAGVDGANRDARAGAYIFEHKKDCWYLTTDLR